MANQNRASGTRKAISPVIVGSAYYALRYTFEGMFANNKITRLE